MLDKYEFDSKIYEIKDNGGAGRVKVSVLFDGIAYEGSIVNMGLKDEQGNICYVIGVLKSIRKALGKCGGDSVHVIVRKR